MKAAADRERPAGRRILGNLLAEAELAPLVLDLPRARRASPSRPAVAAAAGFATLLRAFAEDGDRLWTPAPVDPARLPEVPGLPQPLLESGPLDRLAPTRRLLAWCETPAASALRARAAAGPSARLTASELEAPLHELLWRLPPPPPAAVAALHDRAAHLALARELGCALPGARLVASLAEIEQAAAGVPTWVVKARFSAAGRDRHVEREANGGLADAAVRARLARLLERHGPLLFEPWMARTQDVGAAGLVLAQRKEGHTGLVSWHRQLVDRDGRFQGIELALDFADAGLPHETFVSVERILRHVGAALAEVGYQGPFGVDGWTYRRGDGSPALHLLGEVNVRLTFGLVARALVDRLRRPLGLPASGRASLLLGGATPSHRARALVPLLHPADGAPGAWLAW